MAARMQRVAEESDLSQVVLDQIRQKLDTSEAEVCAATDHGVVTLTGNVRTNTDRIAVESVAKQVRGVRAIANDLQVNPSHERTGAEIARDVLKGLDGHIFLATEDIRVIVFVTSVDPLHMYAMEPEDKFAFAQSIHQGAETTLRTVGLQVESLVKEEDPKLFLIAEAERWNADSIFVGARGLGRIGRFLLGSISTAVVSRAHCSVEVVRAR